MSFDDFKTRRYFGSLDGLRALSIFGVVWHHAARSDERFLSEEGANGVPLFFAISGFLITSLLLRERDQRLSISLKDFYARRSLRIFPLYYTMLGVYALLVLVKERGTQSGAEFVHNLPYFATYTSNWFVHLEGRVIFYFAWSLATEEQFYLIWPSVEKWLPGGAVTVALSACLLRALVASDLLPLDHDSFVRTLVLSIHPAICLGVVLAHLLHTRRTFNVVERLLGGRFASLGALLLLLAALSLDAPELLQHALMVFLVGTCVIHEDHLLAPLFRSRVAQSVGKVSYGIYLMHMLVLNAVERVSEKIHVQNRFLLFVAAFLTTWAVALVSFNYFESWFLSLKGRFSRAQGLAVAPTNRC